MGLGFDQDVLEHLLGLCRADDPKAWARVARLVVVARVEELVAHVQHRLGRLGYLEWLQESKADKIPG